MTTLNRILALASLIISASTAGAQTPIFCGQTITSSIGAPSEADFYIYNGDAGETRTFAFVGSGDCSYGYNAVMDLYNPSGQKIASLSHCGVRSTNVTLAASGAYTILVHDDDYAQTSTYAVTIQSFTDGGCDSTPIVCGRTISTNVSHQAEIDAYSYVGNAGETRTFSFAGSGDCYYGYNAVMDLYNPSGQKIANLSHCGARSTNVTLAASGTYTILVHDDDYAETSGYALSIQSFTGGGCSSTPIACGQTISTNISKTAQVDAYSYVGSTGQTLTVGFVGSGDCYYGYNAVMDLYNPGGQKVASLSHCGVRSTNLTLAVSGTYTILVHDDDYAQASSYALSVQSFSGGGCSATAISCGQTIGTNISRKAEIDAYSYVGNAGETRTFGFVGSGDCYYGYNAVMDLYNPSGQKIASLSHCGARSTNMTLAASGAYTILVHDDDYAESSTYALSIQSFTGGGCSSTPIVSGQTISSNISRQAQVDAFGFGVGPGTLILSFVGSGDCYYGYNAVIEVYNPSGQRVASLSHCGAHSTNFAIATSGTYTFLVHDDDYAQTTGYSFTATYIGPCTYSRNPANASVGAGATNGTVNVTAGPGANCNWTATTSASWLRITSGTNGTGNGTVSYLVEANSGTNERAGEMVIAGWTFSVKQAAVQPLFGDPVGDVGVTGSFTNPNGIYTVSGSGEDIEDTADAFYFVHQPLAGDGQIIARVLSLQASQSDAEVGVMIRESLDAGSKHAFLRLNTGTNTVFRRRLTTGAASIENPHSGTNSAWLRLMRLGNTFVGFSSSNGVDWKYVWFTTINMSNQVEVGLAVTAHHRGQIATGRVDNVFIGGLAPLSGIWPEAGPRIYLGGEPLGPGGLQPLGGFKMLVRGAPGDLLNILASSNVAAPSATWSVLGTGTNQWGALPFLDTSALTNSMQFYKTQRVGP